MQQSTEKRIVDMVGGCGFGRSETLGFVGFARTRADGVQQSLRISWWQNKKVAQAKGIPHHYLVLCPGFDSPNEQTRVLALMAERPFADQVDRPWEQVVAEVRASFLPLFDLPADEAWARLQMRTIEVENLWARALR